MGHILGSVPGLRDNGQVDCDVAREALSARLDGEREPVPSARVDEHLAACPGCRGWYAETRDWTAQLQGMRDAPELHLAAVLPSESGGGRRRRWLSWWRAVLRAVLVVLRWRRGGPDRMPLTSLGRRDLADIELPENATRGRRQGHLRPAGDPAA